MTDIANNIVNLPAVTTDYDPLAPAHFEHSQRVAKMFAASELVPPHLRGKMADCLIAYAIAKRTREEPLVVLQNIYFVSGRAGWSATYMIAKANRSGVFARRINWRVEGEGKNLRVTAVATLADSGEPVEATASMAMAEAEGWTKNPKYRTMPDQMLRYRSATMLIRLFAPEVMMGLPVADEIDYSQARGPSGAIDITPPPASSPLAAVTQAMDALLDATEQEADNTAPAASDADSPAAASPDAPTGALPQELAERARAIVAAIRKAQTVKDIDRVMLAQRGNLDDISAASAEAHERIMEESRRRVAEVAG
jgi:hypothetical protein